MSEPEGRAEGAPGPTRQGWASREGAPLPLGASWIPEEQAYNFALYSKHAEEVTLLLYAPWDLEHPVVRQRLDYLVNKCGRVWHCRVPAASCGGARYYGWSIDGPSLVDSLKNPDPGDWHAFDASKVLLDPYARVIFFPPGYDRDAARQVGVPNGGKALLGLLPSPGPRHDWAARRRPHHDADLVIYELHVRGFTRSPSSGLPAAKRGTYAGVVEKIPHLQRLGVTAVELLPVFQFDPGEPNYWGYMPLGFFAPHQQFASDPAPDGTVREFQEMVQALHQADIEVLLDVVYNHSAEGSERGPTFGLRGIDNSTYYLMTGDPSRPYDNASGCGNTLRCATPAVRQLIMDSLRHWAGDLGVDGFRFDEASVLSRDESGAIDKTEPAIFGEIASDPILSKVRLIAEPWDAAGRDELGRQFPGVTWQQWNGRFRDVVRRFLRGDAGQVGALMSAVYGSRDELFSDEKPYAYRPVQSVNYFASHDGFTLCDLVSYDREDQHSWDCVWPSATPGEVAALRRRQAKNFCALLFLSNGTPMLRAGDELLQTQGGDPNPYAEDGPKTWIDWSLAEANAEVLRFFQRMIAFRKAHPTLCRSRFWRGDVTWHGVGAEPDLSPESRCLAFHLRGAADAELYVMVNAHWEPHAFQVQGGDPAGWRLALDTGLASPGDFPDPGAGAELDSAAYMLGPRSVAVLVRA
jgi:isoamylase